MVTPKTKQASVINDFRRSTTGSLSEYTKASRSPKSHIEINSWSANYVTTQYKLTKITRCHPVAGESIVSKCYQDYYTHRLFSSTTCIYS